MKRKIIHINQELCNGCGLCVDACHEGAIHMVDGKARLLRDDYCDGLGDCLPTCPTGAITFETRVAAPFDKEAVALRMAQLKKEREETGEDAAVKDSRWPSTPPFLRAPTCCWRLTVPPTPTGIFTGGSCRARSPSSAAPNWTRPIMP